MSNPCTALQAANEDLATTEEELHDQAEEKLAKAAGPLQYFDDM
jgi:hypothetical protein